MNSVLKNWAVVAALVVVGLCSTLSPWLPILAVIDYKLSDALRLLRIENDSFPVEATSTTPVAPVYEGEITYLYFRDVYNIVSSTEKTIPVSRDTYYRLNIGDSMDLIYDQFSEDKMDDFPGQRIMDKNIIREYFQNDPGGTMLDLPLNADEFEDELIQLLRPHYKNVHVEQTREGLNLFVTH